MRKTTIGAILLVLLGAAAIAAWNYLTPILFEKDQLDTSDARGEFGTVRFGGDNYLGYWFITSPEMRKAAARRGLRIQFEDDGGAYADRLQKFAAREYDCIVLPVNSYLQHAAKFQFPGVIVASISESRGADGIVGFSDKLPSGKINDLNDPSLEIVYTGESPSSFLLDLTIADFDLDRLRASDEWRREVGSSREVFEAAQANRGDAFVLWEPDLTRALALPGMKYIWGSDKFAGYIVDVFVFHRDFLKSKPHVVNEFFKLYFRVLSLYKNNRENMIEQMGQSADLEETTVAQMLEKIDWFDLNENCFLQFGIADRVGDLASEGIINSIIAATDVMLRAGRLTSDPLEGNPYRITNSTILEELKKTQTVGAVAAAPGVKVQFDEINEQAWSRLKEVGTFRVEQITFQSWNNLLTDEGKVIVDKIATLLTNNYPYYRVIVRGHTAPGGDEKENEKLSLQRAQAVAQYLRAVHGFDANRLKIEGVGSKIPPAKKPGESPRSYQYRLARVEFVAVEGSTL